MIESEDKSIIDVTGQNTKTWHLTIFNSNNQSSYQQTQYSYNSYDPNEYRLGKQYKDNSNFLHRKFLGS